ncbi:MAG: hypothetical protein PHD82_05800 [Candidatus Riflebacteria bacterium]|nr:hypothetical protein [Candidatus Riflebacteria bacterium]
MKKCTRYLDALDHQENENSALWQDLLLHASRCPDCALDMKVRTEMLEKLAETPEPMFPADLHQSILNTVSGPLSASTVDDEPGFLERLFEKFLQPFEILVPAACILMFVFLLQLNAESGADSTQKHLTRAQPKARAFKVAQLPSPEQGSLEHVSGEEVKAFLARLEEFRREHPEEPLPTAAYVPDIELVNDGNLWRKP